MDIVIKLMILTISMDIIYPVNSTKIFLTKFSTKFCKSFTKSCIINTQLAAVLTLMAYIIDHFSYELVRKFDITIILIKNVLSHLKSICSFKVLCIKIYNQAKIVFSCKKIIVKLS